MKTAKVNAYTMHVFGKKELLSIQLLSKIFIDSDFCHNYLHTLYLFACLL